MEEYLRLILEFHGIEFHETIIVLENIQLVIGIIQANVITYRVKYTAVHIGYTHEQFDLHNTSLDNILTHIKPDDMGKKPFSGPLNERHFSYIHGVRFYHTEYYGHFYQIDIHLNTMHQSSLPINS